MRRPGLMTTASLLLCIQGVCAQDLSGAWYNSGNADEVCGVLHQRDDRVTIIDEDRYRGYGHIDGDSLVITRYERKETTTPDSPLTAVINADQTRLEWSGNFWKRDPQAVQIWLMDLICQVSNDAPGILRGDDEIYITRILNGHAEVVENRVWAYLDRGRRARNILLWQGVVPQGEFVDLTFVVMEEDDDRDVFVNALGTALSQAGGGRNREDRLTGIDEALKAAASLAADPDDHIGTFSCGMWRRPDGRLRSRWNALRHCRKTNKTSDNDPHASTLEVANENGEYELWVYPYDR